MGSVRRRVSDRPLLGRVEQWRVAPVEEADGRGGKRRTTRAKDEKRGIAQGAPLSPLRSNRSMRRFVLGWKRFGSQARYGVIVNDADDVVIGCRTGAAQAMEAMRRLMGKLDLTVNEDKTRVCHVGQDSFDFLGSTIGPCHDRRTGERSLAARVSKKSLERVTERLSAMTKRSSTGGGVAETVVRLNRVLTGWGSSFTVGLVSDAKRTVDAHARRRRRRWLRMKHKVGDTGRYRFPDAHWPARESRTCGSASGDWKRSHGVDRGTGNGRKPPATATLHRPDATAPVVDSTPHHVKGAGRPRTRKHRQRERALRSRRLTALLRASPWRLDHRATPEEMSGQGDSDRFSLSPGPAHCTDRRRTPSTPSLRPPDLQRHVQRHPPRTLASDHSPEGRTLDRRAVPRRVRRRPSRSRAGPRPPARL